MFNVYVHDAEVVEHAIYTLHGNHHQYRHTTMHIHIAYIYIFIYNVLCIDSLDLLYASV